MTVILAASFLRVVVWGRCNGSPIRHGGVIHRVQLEWGVEWLRRWGLFLGFRVGRHFGFDQDIAGSRFPGPLPGWLLLLRPVGGRLCWCLGGQPLVGG